MIFGLDEDLLLLFGSGVLTAVLGGLVLLVRPRTPVSMALAVGLVSFGVAAAMNNRGGLDPSLRTFQPAAELLSAALFLLASGAFGALAWLFPRPLAAQERRMVVLPLLVLFSLTVAVGARAVTAYEVVGLEFGILSRATAAGRTAASLLRAVMVAAAILFAFRFRTLPSGDLAGRRQLALMAGALIVYPAMRGALVPPRNDYPGWVSYAFLAAILVATAVWLLAIPGSDGTHAARNVALLGPAAVLAGMTFRLLDWGWQASAGRFLAMAVLVYAMLQHRILGLDARVRWGIGRGTLAGIFVATFFVASEAAQQFFGDAVGGPYAGILAAGALVFAFAPLSRLADRFAAKAVPARVEPPRMEIASREEAYRSALRLALRGGITRAEEMELGRIAEANGISMLRALALRHEVEDSQAGARTVHGPERRRSSRGKSRSGQGAAWR